MATQNDRQINDFSDISSAEMIQIQGGVWFPKYYGVDGESNDSASGGGGGSGGFDLAALDIQRAR